MKRKHEELKKTTVLRSCPYRTVFNLRFTDEDEVKCHVQKVHPKKHVNLHLLTCLKVGRRGLGPLLDAKQAATNLLSPNVKRSSNRVFFSLFFEELVFYLGRYIHFQKMDSFPYLFMY